MANLNTNGHGTAPHKPSAAEIDAAVESLALRVQGTLDQLSRDIGISPETAEQIKELLIADVRAKTRPDGQLALRLEGRRQ
jgi:hypothetical protein